MFDAMLTAYAQLDRAKPLMPSKGVMGLIWLPDCRQTGRYGATDGAVVLFIDPDESGWRLTCQPLFSEHRLRSETLEEAQHEAERLVSGSFQGNLALDALD